jgi:hypothetical protein
MASAIGSKAGGAVQKLSRRNQLQKEKCPNNKAPIRGFSKMN